MPPTIYIHIGQHKTGTTSVQHFCRLNRDELRTRLGLYYPLPAQAPYHRHPRLFPFNKGEWHKIRREMETSDCTRLLISHEGWYVHWIRDSDVEAIRECFPGSEIFFILYLRRLDDYCKSLYNERLKNGTISQPGYSAYWKRLAPQSSYLYPSRLLQQCERQVGRDHLLVRIYDLRSLKNGDSIDDMFDAMGLVLPEGLKKGRRYNQSLPNAALPYMTETLIRASKDDPLRKEMRRKMTAAFSRRDEGGANEALLADLEKEIELLDACYLPGYKKLFEKRKCDLSFPELEASPKDVLIVDLLYSILFELRKRQDRSFSRQIKKFVYKHLTDATGRLAAFFQKRPPTSS